MVISQWTKKFWISWKPCKGHPWEFNLQESLLCSGVRKYRNNPWDQQPQHRTKLMKISRPRRIYRNYWPQVKLEKRNMIKRFKRWMSTWFRKKANMVTKILRSLKSIILSRTKHGKVKNLWMIRTNIHGLKYHWKILRIIATIGKHFRN